MIKKSLVDKAIKKSFEMAQNIDGKYKHLSFIFYKNRLVGQGSNNRYKTHTIAAKYNDYSNFIHGELSALQNYLQNNNASLLKYCTLLNLRIGLNGNLAYCRPCRGCQKLIAAFNFKNVFYTNELGIIEEFLWKH